MAALFNKEISGQVYQIKDLDILEIPIEGVAAYWLSLKKVMKQKWNKKLLQEEAEYTSEKFIQHLLNLVLTSFNDEQISKYARIKKETIVNDLQRKMVVISIGVLGIAANENPQQVLVRIISKFSLSPFVEQQVFSNAKKLLQGSQERVMVADIDHRMPIEELVSHLIFYSMLARREGKEACRPFMEKIRSAYFNEGLNMTIDGFNKDFIKHRLNLQKNEIIYETKRKMELALEMSLALKNNVQYEDMFQIANAFLL